MSASSPSQALRCGRHAERGVAATRDEGADAIAGAPVRDAFTERVDDACDFETGEIARARRRRIHPAALHHIGAIHARRSHADQYLSAARNRIGPLDQPQHVWRPRRRNLDGPHWDLGFGTWDLGFTSSAEGSRGDEISRANSAQRRSALAAVPPRDSTYAATMSRPRL